MPAKAPAPRQRPRPPQQQRPRSPPQERPRRSVGAAGRALLHVALAGAAAWLAARANRGHREATASRLSATLACPADYEHMPEPCRPKRCGHAVVDGFASAEEVATLQSIAAAGMAHGGGAGGPTVLDLHSGALSLGRQFVSLWHVLNATKAPPIASTADLDLLETVYARVRREAEAVFGAAGLGLAAPTFWSRLNGSLPAQTVHDEYWHYHVDTRQYGTFAYTGLLYLADYGADFEGGSFEFRPHPPERPHPVSILPTRGRLLLFTSGSENEHRVNKVTKGVRLALTVPFTCDEDAGLRAEWLAEARASAGRRL